MRQPSVTQPIPIAFERTKRILFEPFALHKWLRLGFCAFLMGLAEASGWTGGGGGDGDQASSNSSADVERGLAWIQDHLSLVLAAGSVALVFIVALVSLLLWLSSRGRFMLLDGVVRNRGAIQQPWREYRREANALFRFRFCFGLLALLGLAVIVGLCVWMARPDLQARVFAGHALTALLTGGVLMVAFIITISLVLMVLMDFLVPIMYLRRVAVKAAWQEFRSSMLRGNLNTFILYALIRLLLSIGIACASTVVILLSCCVALLPYIGSVILLPFIVFQLTYPLCFIEQFGADWQIFSRDRKYPTMAPQS